MTLCARNGSSGKTIAPPSMSTNAVINKTTSLPILYLLARLAQCCGWCAAADHAGNRDDGEDVRNHRDELRWNYLCGLQLDLQRLRGGEQQTGYSGARRIPASEDNGCESDESSSRRHRIGELVLVERQIYTAQRGKSPRRDHRDVAHAVHRHADTRRRLWMLADGAHAQAEPCPVDHEREHRHHSESEPHHRIREERPIPAAGRAAEPDHARRIRTRTKRELQKKS